MTHTAPPPTAARAVEAAPVATTAGMGAAFPRGDRRRGGPARRDWPCLGAHASAFLAAACLCSKCKIMGNTKVWPGAHE